MTMPGVSCTAVATQNSSEWPCSMCPFPQLRLVGVRTSYIYIYTFLIFPGHLEFWTPLQIPIWGPPLGCTLLQYHLVVKTFSRRKRDLPRKQLEFNKKIVKTQDFV